ncbi:glycosyl hydrolase family 8 [Paracraurococcus ruber]|nr:glycosyl hydrolase family 8 [Paracraurococcus ruber]
MKTLMPWSGPGRLASGSCALIGRRDALGAMTLATLIGRDGPAAADPGPLPTAWAQFKARFVGPEGRVLDTGQAGASHTEGQGWGMLAALAVGDRAVFHQLHDWTRKQLSRPTDSLFSWRWRPGQTPPVDDPNNATDGDLYIAWALARAGERWGDPALLRAARSIGADILRLLLREAHGHLVLMPGLQGFEDEQRIVLNPSYYVFSAFAALDRILPDARWRRLTRDGLRLMRQARFGASGLPPDWIELQRATGTVSPARGWEPRFGFDAVRVPLLLCWANHRAEPVLAAAARFAGDPARGTVPAWLDLETGAVAPYPASGGMQAIHDYASWCLNGGRPPAPALAASDDYYSAALKLLVLMAVAEA